MAKPSPLFLPHLLYILFLLAAAPNQPKAAAAPSNTFPGDIAALKAVIAALDSSSFPAGSCLSSWDFSLDPCTSAFGPNFTCGLRCDAVSGDGLFARITDLSLDGAGYSGSLSPLLWSLPFLQSLDLSNNRLSGPIPPPRTAGLPPLLRRLSLSRNSLSGDVPCFHPAPSLQELYLDGNRFSGPIPSSLPSSLRRLELQSNGLSGELPDLTQLSNLYFLDASDNALSGPFPSALPPSLVELSLRNNLLAGDLPSTAITALPALQVLDLSHNVLVGAVPAAAFDHPALEQLTLARNSFEWVEEPADGGTGSPMVALDLGHNRLAGLLPEFLGSMPHLAALVLENNRFTGLIPAQYAMRASGGGGVPFGRLLLAGNYLYGPIPSLFQGMKEGTAMVSLADNCLFRCPEELFFCAGAEQKPSATCRNANPMIP
ncbi:inactive leucine-rich repeat receptor-like protein kinase [Apostasia shenzhenica]|uniref:Inactive leucine-rich repeat receptor-like protein kinase n=1 Tax=Apostasia shenzhenica TaxID=1088818 RepID=A0A2H9ZT88_9ASPA|nr:inactive leucine-rich repeat receptor-like protein kinase [Apostasia shenzhenica]